MAALFLLRHGPTEWTASRRLQGRSDIPLSAVGRSVVETWELPKRAAQCAWAASPLSRCIETAEIMQTRYRHTEALGIEPRLIEMSFGEWEGRSLAELRSIHGPLMAEWESRGLDFRAPAGESPRDVQHRLRPWLEEMANASSDILAITHKGVMRALYALASGWDMRERPAFRLTDNALHQFELDRAGLRIGRMSIPLYRQAQRTKAAP